MPLFSRRPSLVRSTPLFVTSEPESAEHGLRYPLRKMQYASVPAFQRGIYTRHHRVHRGQTEEGSRLQMFYTDSESDTGRQMARISGEISKLHAQIRVRDLAHAY